MSPIVPFLYTRSRTKSDSQPLVRPIVQLPSDPSTKTTNMMTRPGSLIRGKTLSQMEAPEIDYISSKPIAKNSVMWSENKSVGHIPFPGNEQLSQQQIKEEDDDTDSDSELEWGIQENMKLFEVSAKDDHGERVNSSGINGLTWDGIRGAGTF